MKHVRRYLKVFGAVLLPVGALAALVLTRDDAVALPAELSTLNASVDEGRYLAAAGNCFSCHTAEDGDPYAGGVPFHTPFGVLYSTNITSDHNNGIGSWSFAEFHASMKYGVRPDGSHLYPAFPYTDFAHLTDTHIASLYLFFQTVVPSDAVLPKNELKFPFNQRSLMAPWKWLFHDANTWQENLSESPLWNRGAYLVEGLGHCGACHTPRNALGAERQDLAFTGASYQDKVLFGNYRPWSGVNLTSHEAGLATWSEEDIADYLGTGISAKAIVHGPMVEVIANSTSQLSSSDLRAIAVYLKSLPANAQDKGPMPDAVTMAAGEVGYTVHCGSCHLPSGTGEEGLGISLVSSPIVRAADPSSLVNVILYGPHLPARLVVNRSKMKMMGKRLSDVDIANIASYVRTEFGGDAGAVTPALVKRQR